MKKIKELILKIKIGDYLYKYNNFDLFFI